MTLRERNIGRLPGTVNAFGVIYGMLLARRLQRILQAECCRRGEHWPRVVPTEVAQSLTRTNIRIAQTLTTNSNCSNNLKVGVRTCSVSSDKATVRGNVFKKKLMLECRSLLVCKH